VQVAAAVGLARVGQTRHSKGGFTQGKAEEGERETGNAVRRPRGRCGSRRRAHGGGARHYCSGEQLPWRGSEKKRGKRARGFLTTTRSSGGARTSREGGGTVVRLGFCGGKRRRHRSMGGQGRVWRRLYRDRGSLVCVPSYGTAARATRSDSSLSPA
jgi:hypothetical protein